MTDYRKALNTIETMISRQEKAIERIFGKPSKTKVTGTSNMEQNPEISTVAPHHGTFNVPGYTIQRVHCDQLRNFYFWRN